MKPAILLICLLFLCLAGSVGAQDTPTPIPVVVTVILVYPSATPSPTATEGPTPTPTATPTATPNAVTTYYGESGADVLISHEVRPADVAIVGLLVLLVGLKMAQMVYKAQEIRAENRPPSGGFNE